MNLVGDILWETLLNVHKLREMIYRIAERSETEKLRLLGMSSWSRYQALLAPEHWTGLWANVSALTTYENLLSKGTCFVCELDDKSFAGMAVFVPSGNEDGVYEAAWCQLRYVCVREDAGGQGIGRRLVELCLSYAREHSEHTMALHTSELMNTARHIYESLSFVQLREIDSKFGMRYWLYTCSL